MHGGEGIRVSKLRVAGEREEREGRNIEPEVAVK